MRCRRPTLKTYIGASPRCISGGGGNFSLSAHVVGPAFSRRFRTLSRKAFGFVWFGFWSGHLIHTAKLFGKTYSRSRCSQK